MRFIRLLKNDLEREVTDWSDDGLISESQAENILARYGIVPGEGRSYGYNLLIGFGFLFIGLAVIILVSANWDEIPRWVRMLTLVLLTSATHGVGVRFHDRGEEASAVGAFFLGNLFYGASIILIAQIYHLGEHMPDGIYWWALGCLPIAVLSRSRLIALQMTVLAVIWLLVEANLGFYPATFPLFVAAAAYVLLRSGGSLLLFLLLIVSTVLWLQYSLSAWWQSGAALDFEAEHLVVSISMFAAIYGFSHWLAKRGDQVIQDYGVALSAWCLRFVLLLLVVFSFGSTWGALIEADWNHQVSMSVIAAFFWAIALVLSVRANHYLSLAAFLVLFILTVVSVVLVDSDVYATSFQLGYNLVLLCAGVWLIIRGITDNISHYFYSGVLAILLTALLRYFDLIGDYIGGAAMFLVMAGILLGAARYWKQHHGGDAA